MQKGGITSITPMQGGGITSIIPMQGGGVTSITPMLSEVSHRWVFYDPVKIRAFPSMDFLWSSENQSFPIDGFSMIREKVVMNHRWPIDGLFMKFQWSIDAVHWEPNPGGQKPQNWSSLGPITC